MTTTELTNRFIQPIADGTRGYGDRMNLLREYARIAGYTPHRSQIDRWLAHEPAERVEPSIGAALALQIAFKRMKRKHRREGRNGR